MQKYGTAVPLGAGSFADVYRCFDTQLRRTVALKLLRWNEPESVERMFREARAQAKVDHEGVCKVYDTGWKDGRPFIAMQYVEGDDLISSAADLPLRDRLRLMVKVIAAVQAAHEQGLVHRDLKPDNILVQKEADGSLRPVVLDFGLAFDQAATTCRMTHRGEPLGTPAFMAPEQAAGQLDKIDARTDVYGLGATLYALLTGHVPFDGQGTTDLLIQAIEAEPVAPRERLPTLPIEVESIVLKCLEKRRHRRYGSAQEVADDLTSFLEGRPISAGASGWWYPIQRRARRYRRRLAVAMAFAGIALMALWAFEQQAREASKRAEVEQRFVQISNDLDWGFRAAQMSSTHDITPSRERVRQRIAELENELGDLDKLGRGPAHYAIGRAFAALREDEDARRHLETAWQLGHRTPEVGYFLGLVIGRQYEDALERVRHVNEAELRKIYLDDVISRYRDPAKLYLEAGRKAEAVSVEYVEALIDFYEERYDSALAKLADVRRSLPWLYEASIAEGKVLQRMADERFAQSEVEEALELYRRAEQSLRRAMASASSDPQVYPELCKLLTRRIEAELDWSIPPSDATWEDHLEVCDRGLEVDPYSARAHRTSALAHELLARISLDRSWNPDRARQAIDRAEQLAEEAVRLHAEEPDVHSTLARIRMTRGRLASLLRESEHQLETYLLAGQNLEEAMRRSSGPQGLLAIQISLNQQLIASVLRARWQPADEPLRRAVQLIRKQVELAPSSFTLHCEAGNAELGLALESKRQNQPFEEHLDSAERSYQRCLELNEKYHWAYIGLAQILDTRGAAECQAGKFDGHLPSQARELIEKVVRLDPGFEGANLRLASSWATEAHCQLIRGASPQQPLTAMRGLIAEAEVQGLPVDFLKTYATTLEIRYLLTQDPSHASRTAHGSHLQPLRRLYEAQSHFVGVPRAAKDPGTEAPTDAPADAPVSRRLYRIDQILWLAEAAWQLGEPTRPWTEKARVDLDDLAAFTEGELVGRPEIRVQEWVLGMMQARQARGQSFRSELRACAAGLETELERQPGMGPHVKPWLHRIDLLERRLG